MKYEDPWDTLVNDLNALEQAIEEVCDADTIAKIQTRKEELQKK